jgi:hypothetical protein
MQNKTHHRNTQKAEPPPTVIKMSLNLLSHTWCHHPPEPLDIDPAASQILVGIAFLYIFFGNFFQGLLGFYIIFCGKNIAPIWPMSRFGWRAGSVRVDN